MEYLICAGRLLFKITLYWSLLVFKGCLLGTKKSVAIRKRLCLQRQKSFHISLCCGHFYWAPKDALQCWCLLHTCEQEEILVFNGQGNAVHKHWIAIALGMQWNGTAWKLSWTFCWKMSLIFPELDIWSLQTQCEHLAGIQFSVLFLNEIKMNRRMLFAFLCIVLWAFLLLWPQRESSASNRTWGNGMELWWEHQAGC